MPATPPPGGTESARAKALAQYGRIIVQYFPGVYKGKDPRYQGLTWEQVYFAIAEKAPNLSPLYIANKVAGLAAVQNIAYGVGAFTSQSGNFANDAIKAGAGIHGFGFGGFGSILDFLNALGDPHLWLRIAEGILGIILIATAVSKMTGAGSAIGKVARKVPLVV
jgi:hypothetical protein